MKKNLFDQHVHSSFSYDAEKGAPIGDIIEAAIQAGLAGIAVTDHLDPLWPDENEPSVLDVPAYEKTLTEAESTYGDRIRFIKGIELGLIPGEALDICQTAVSGYAYDFVIGSTHSSSLAPIDYPAFLEGRELRDIIDEYYTLLLDGVRAYKNYDVIGHINSIDRYTEGFADESVYMPYVDEILRVAISDGKGIEVNTSSYRYGIGDRGTPTRPVLERYKELGGEIVTLGSDAHRISDIGAFLEKGEENLLAAGFKYIAVFKGRQPEFFRI